MSTCKVPISDLPEKKPLVGNESIPIVDTDTGLTKKSNLNELSSFITLDYVTTGGNTTTNSIRVLDLSASNHIISQTGSIIADGATLTTGSIGRGIFGSSDTTIDGNLNVSFQVNQI